MVKYTKFGTKARAIMLKNGITSTSIAKELNISSPYLSDIFKGTRSGKKQKPLIAEILGIKLVSE